MKAIFITRKGSVQITEERDIDHPHQIYVVPLRATLSVDAGDVGSNTPLDVSHTTLTYRLTKTTIDGVPVYLNEN